MPDWPNDVLGQIPEGFGILADVVRPHPEPFEAIQASLRPPGVAAAATG